jgi:hypothetical protein
MSIEIEQAIAQYRSQLTSEAELARADLAEIEDHLRTLIEELHDAGMPVAEAIAEAASRLGDPRQLAREHARVRTPFGARLSRTRAWSATLMLLPSLWVDVRMFIAEGLGTLAAFQLIAMLAIVAGLALRQAWARAIVLGLLADAAINMIYYAAIMPEPSTFAFVEIVFAFGALAFVAPWRRSELTGIGCALVLLGPTYHGAMILLGLVPPDVWGVTALLAVLAAGAGAVLRARWATLAAALASVALAGGIIERWNMIAVGPHATLMRVYVFGSMTLATVAAVSTALLSWRAARSTFGTLRGVIS